jgi:hypothetical protein
MCRSLSGSRAGQKMGAFGSVDQTPVAAHSFPFKANFQASARYEWAAALPRRSHLRLGLKRETLPFYAASLLRNRLTNLAYPSSAVMQCKILPGNGLETNAACSRTTNHNACLALSALTRAHDPLPCPGSHLCKRRSYLNAPA